MQKLLALILVALSIGATRSNAIAQDWQLLHQFPGYISFVKLYNGALFVGTGILPDGNLGHTTLFRSTDKGRTWLQCTIPAGNNAKMSDLLMLDGRVGFVTVWGDGARAGLWKTTNGGETWTETGVKGSLTSIAGDSHRVIVTDLFGSAKRSLDGGKNFSDLTASQTNDITFLDNQHGAMSNFRGDGFRYTTDGGAVWKTSNQSVECWSICADTTSNSYFAAPECATGSASHTQIFRSTDFGETWQVVSTLPFVSTGHIVASDGQLFAQVQSGINGSRYGVYTSYDRGSHWTELGGPSACSDTRFLALHGCSGPIVYAFDANSRGSLYRYGRPDDDLYYATYFANRTAAIDSMLDVPLAVRLPLKYGVQHRDVRHIDFTVVSSADALVIEGFNAPKGWRLTALTSLQLALQISLDRAVATSPGDSCSLGELSVHAVHPGRSTISIEDVVIEDDSSTTGLCSVPEGQAVSSVTVNDNLAAVSSILRPRLYINGVALDIDDEATSTVSIRVLDINGATIDERELSITSQDVRYEIPHSFHGPCLVSISNSRSTRILKVITP